jgi:hypothetical protein
MPTMTNLRTISPPQIRPTLSDKPGPPEQDAVVWRQLRRNTRVECIASRAALDEETIAEENKFRGGLGFENAG